MPRNLGIPTPFLDEFDKAIHKLPSDHEGSPHPQHVGPHFGPASNLNPAHGGVRESHDPTQAPAPGEIDASGIGRGDSSGAPDLGVRDMGPQPDVAPNAVVEVPDVVAEGAPMIDVKGGVTVDDPSGLIIKDFDVAGTDLAPNAVVEVPDVVAEGAPMIDVKGGVTVDDPSGLIIKDFDVAGTDLAPNAVVEVPDVVAEGAPMIDVKGGVTVDDPSGLIIKDFEAAGNPAHAGPAEAAFDHAASGGDEHDQNAAPGAAEAHFDGLGQGAQTGSPSVSDTAEVDDASQSEGGP